MFTYKKITKSRDKKPNEKIAISNILILKIKK